MSGRVEDPYLVRCKSLTCSANAFNVSDAQMRQWHWVVTDEGTVQWTCRRCVLETPTTEGTP